MIKFGQGFFIFSFLILGFQNSSALAQISAFSKNYQNPGTYFCETNFRGQGQEISFNTDLTQIQWQNHALFQTKTIELFSDRITINTQKEGFSLRSNPIFNSLMVLKIYTFDATAEKAPLVHCHQPLDFSKRNLFLHASANFMQWQETGKTAQVILRSNVRLNDQTGGVFLEGQNIEIAFKNQQITSIGFHSPLQITQEGKSVEIRASRALADLENKKLTLLGNVQVLYLGRLALKSERLEFNLKEKWTFAGIMVDVFLLF